jgi:hypothetical protein
LKSDLSNEGRGPELASRCSDCLRIETICDRLQSPTGHPLGLNALGNLWCELAGLSELYTVSLLDCQGIFGSLTDDSAFLLGY